jgi:hypothetical protein
MALRVELGGDSRYGQSLALPGLSTKLLHALDQVLLGRKMTVRLHPFDAFTSGALASSSRSASAAAWKPSRRSR